MRIETLINKYFWPLSIFFVLTASVRILYFCAIDISVWFDESYTMSMIEHSFSDIVRLTAVDVHPPLYYLSLKAFTLITGENSLFVLRVFSFLSVATCFVLALFPVRRLLGRATALIFIALLSLMPVTQYLGTEIRMYSWAMFFVLGCSVYAYDAYRRNSAFAYTMTSVFAICSAYTHNYALVAAGFIYLIFVVSQYRKNRKIRNVLISFAIFALAYMAWIPAILFQIGTVKNNYWIGALTAKDFLLTIYYFFSPKMPNYPYTIFSKPAMIVGISVMLLFIALIAFVILRKHFKKPIDRKLLVGDAFVAVYLLTVVFTLIISLTVKPIILPRYTVCVLGPLLLGISVYIAILIRERYKLLLALAFASLLVLITARVLSDITFIRKQKDDLKEIGAFLNREGSPTFIIATPDSYSLFAELSAMFPEKKAVLYSPYMYVDVQPFSFGVIKFIPDSLSFYHLESLVSKKDSIEVGNNHIIEDQLSYPKFNIYLLKPDN